MELTIDISTYPYIRVCLNFKGFGKDECLHIARWRPGRYEAANYTKFLRNVYCEDASGTPVRLTKPNFYTWKPHLLADTSLTLTYDFYANQLDAGGTYVDRDICYFNFLNFVMFSPAHLQEPVEIKVNLPEEFETATALSSNGNSWTARDFYELADSPFLASPDLSHLTYECHGIPFHVWLQNVEGSDKVVEDFRAFTDQQINDLGFFPQDAYHFLIITYPEKLYHGVEHGKSTVICLGPSNEVLNSRYDDLLGISSHELFHAWNIIYVRPNEFMPYEFREIASIDTGFVAEGFTTYLGDLFLVRSGVKDTDWYLKELGILFRRHFENFGRLHTSLEDSSRDLWADGYQAAGPDRKGSIYVEGAVFALMLDLKIRLATNNTHSLLDVVRHMLSRFSKTGYSTDDIKQLAAEYIDPASFFEEYLHSATDTRPLLEELLRNIGLELKESSNPVQLERRFGIKALEVNGKWKVMKNHPDNGLKLRPGDLLLKLNEKDFTSNDMTIPEGESTLTIERHGKSRDVLLSDEGSEFFPVLSVELNNATEILSGWLNQLW